MRRGRLSKVISGALLAASVSAGSVAGYAADEFAAPGTASMTMALLTGGTKTRSALEISDQLAMLGAELHANSNLDMSTVRLSALKSKLDPSLELFADVILNPSFPDADFKRQQKLQLAAIDREKNTPVQMALRVFPGLLYGAQHAYGNPLTGSGTAASVAKMTREVVPKAPRIARRKRLRGDLATTSYGL